MTRWTPVELSEEDRAFRKTKEAFLDRMKDLTTMIRAANSEDFKRYSDLKVEVDKIFDKLS